MIVCYVPLSRKKTLANLAACSRQLHALVIPQLYRHVQLWASKKPFDGIGPCRSLRPLAVLLLRRPDLAAMVQRFSLECRLISSQPFVRDKNKLDQVLVDALRKRNLKSKAEAHWLFHLRRKGYHQYTVALLLPALWRLQVLELTGVDTQRIQFLLERPSLPREVGGVNAQLSYVMHAHPSVQFVAALLRIPSVRRLRCKALDDRLQVSKAVSQQEAGTSNVSRLELIDSNVFGVNLGHILLIPRKLEVFVMDSVRFQWPTFPFPSFPRSLNMRDALELHKENLTTLWLGGKDPNTYCSGIASSGYIADLRPFINVRRLGVTPEYLIGNKNETRQDIANAAGVLLHAVSDDKVKDFDQARCVPLRGLLPLSIETLAICPISARSDASVCRYYGRRLIAALKDLLRDRPRSLRSMRLTGDISGAPWIWEGLVSLMELCEIEGVTVLVVDTKQWDVLPNHTESELVDWEMWDVSHELGMVEGDPDSHCPTCRRSALYLGVEELKAMIERGPGEDATSPECLQYRPFRLSNL